MNYIRALHKAYSLISCYMYLPLLHKWHQGNRNIGVAMMDVSLCRHITTLTKWRSWASFSVTSMVLKLILFFSWTAYGHGKTIDLSKLVSAWYIGIRTAAYWYQGPFYSHGFTLMSPWISYHIQFQSVTWNYTVEVWDWISYFFPYFIVDVIIYSCLDKNAFDIYIHLRQLRVKSGIQLSTVPDRTFDR